MSFWYDIKNKNYSSDGKGSWIRAYVDRIVSVLRSDCDTKFSEHFEGILGRHKAADVDCDNGNTVQQNLDFEKAERLEEAESIRTELAAESDEIKAEMQSGDNALSAEISNVNAALKKEIADEASAREADVEAETSARESAVSSEASARTSADANLQTQINGKAPTSHATTATTYGVGTSSSYGHVKVADNLTTTTSGTALSANQGKVLKAEIDALPIEDMSGQTVEAESGTTVTASTGATIIGDLRNRTFYTNGNASAGNIASGSYSTAIGTGATASGDYSVACGQMVKASAPNSVALGRGGTASGTSSVVMGQGNEATNSCCVSFGRACESSGIGALSHGDTSIASGSYAVAIGYNNTASGNYSTAIGYMNTAKEMQFVCGQRALGGTAGVLYSSTGDAFIIGNGTTSSLSNAFRVAYNGAVYGLSAYNSSGADIAELYEWQDGNPGNEDRRGLFVTLDGTKIRLATPEDTYIKGVVSAVPCLVGDSSSEDWQGKYLTDIFGEKLTQTVHYDAEYEEVERIDPETGEKTTEKVLIHDEYDAVQWVLNPEYDPEKEYIPREERPEWSYVSSWGKIVLVDDGSCEVNGFAAVGEGGKATKSDTQTMYRVMERKDDTHILVAVG